MRRGRRGERALALAAALLFAGLAAPAVGDPAGLAPPGECAEPHAGVHAAPDQDALAPDENAPAPDADALAPDQKGDDFEIAGSPRHHFTPQDVAASGAGGSGSERPEPLSLTRDACDAPNAGCGSLLDDAARNLKESTVQSQLPPGAGTRGSGE